MNPTTVEPSLAAKFLSAGTAACIADAFTFPLDTAKVRLQIQGEGSVATSGATTLKYRGLFGTMITMSKQEGPLSLYNGLNAGLQRQMCFASIRIGLYDNVKRFYIGLLDSDAGTASNIAVRILAGITTGCTAVACAQPTDVVKVRMQAQNRSLGQGRYTSTFNAYRTIVTEEGVKGLWKGIIPNMARNAIVNVAEIVCYDVIKESIINYQLMEDTVPCHFVSAVAAGFCTTVIASPVDVMKTRFMNSRQGQYKGAIDCTVKIFREGGGMAFYKGFVPNFYRFVSWNICMWITYEQLKRLMTHLRQKDS
uniref:Mitochondrial brown fat uncoupling protein 1 n=1 Tax=Strigamia maritima TaxID=126957 RepID=T1JCK8_STRMM